MSLQSLLYQFNDFNFTNNSCKPDPKKPEKFGRFGKELNEEMVRRWVEQSRQVNLIERVSLVTSLCNISVVRKQMVIIQNILLPSVEKEEALCFWQCHLLNGSS